MPIYDWQCRACGTRFEALVTPSETPACTSCGSPDPVRLYSPIAGPFKTGLRGAEARRSNATRRAREEQRRERAAERRRQRAQPDG